MPLSLEQLTLLIIVGTLAAIIYSLRVLVLLERRMARMDENLIRITRRVEREELKTEKALKIRKKVKKRKPAKKKKAKPKRKPAKKRRR